MNTTQHTPGPKTTPCTRENLARDIQAAVLARRPDADLFEVATDAKAKGWLLIPHYGIGERERRVDFWSAKTPTGEVFRDERGVSCFDWPVLVAAITKATGSAS